ncbi:MAG: hypothetical protein EOS73_25435 [Mesorhizobium sp.]|uniref:GTA baseplate fiber-binding domain-containing protein n=1 Tax=Mesorhizobium sp. M7A.F.Ca.ET.027.02.1.1 TaxID=2496655 RepID=UPI000FD35C77|nr:phage tail protein [Mesorhizobium sp. M7A.F.Ca.ET.027.02.1.1]RVD16859.1 hypothetical protein EN749_10925 [Mesorhizobium sp. M7A.F.Ca.ET.027.02.1.1]RWD00497.1 MAG: hypothetical protein EOS73_25435 [Mesorhizobium sp.]
MRRPRWVFDEPTAPVVPSVPEVQTTLPTSAYGQTIPVVFGKCRLPAAYIWVPPILTVTSTHVEYWDTITSTTAKMSARLRFARPLVPDSSWTLRKLYANGKLIYDGSTGYRQSGLRFTAYDGRSTQPRDPAMVREEGESNVSAHRGYLDIVVVDFDIIGLGAPPVFEAEWIQDGATTHDYQNFTTLSSGAISYIVPVWEDLQFYGYTGPGGLIRRFSIGALQEFYAFPQGGGATMFAGWRYSRAYDCLFYLGESGDGHWSLRVLDAQNGAVLAAGDDVGTVLAVIGATCLIEIGDGAIYAGSTDDQQLFCYYYKASVPETLTLATETAAGWGGYASIQCLTPGAIRGNEADVWICADNVLVKVIFTAIGTIKSTTVVAALADDLRYAVYDDGDLVVWTDAAAVKRINGTTGAVEFTKTVPYQITAVDSGRKIGDPDLQRLTDELYYAASGTSYFTSLQTGETRSISGAAVSPNVFYYDGQTDTILTHDAFGVPQRLRIISEDGTQRQLEDFLVALMQAGGFDSSEVDTINIDDVIDGAVIDVTAGVRDIARSVCEPYSIAIFERAGQIIFKRAFTDGAFAIDATLSSAGDIADSGGQAIKAKRLNPEEFIARYGINYRDPAEIYQPRAQFGEIPSLPFPVAPADQSVKADMPIIVDADTVKVLATQKVNRLAIERHEFRMTPRAKFLDLEPEDIERFTFADRIITARIMECTVRPDFMIDVTATEFLSSVSVSISGATGNPTEPNPVGTPESRYHHLDIPLLSDADDLAGAGFVQYHVLASAGQPYWDGATLFRKDASGIYQPVGSQPTNGLVGIALEILPDWDIPYVTEFTRTLNLTIISGNTDLLTSATYLEVMNGANVFAIGQPGRWEICHVMTITNNGDGTFTFEGLRRGRKSSEEYTALHQAGDFVVWLSAGNVQNIDYSIASLDDAFDFKPVGFGGTLAGTVAVNRTVTGEAEKIPKPCQLAATVVGSDIVLDWVRRTRIGSYWSDDGDYTAPLGETLEQYVVRIKDGPAGAVLRTFTVDDVTTKTYLAANITTDFGSIPAQLTFDVRQVSGTGVICPTREETIDL